MQENRVGAEYLQKLQGVYHKIDSRGILVSRPRLESARNEINTELSKHLDTIKSVWGCHVYLGADNDDGSLGSVNLNASSGSRTPLAKLQSLGYKIPKVSKRNEEGEYESKESLAELALQKLLSANQFNILGGDPVIKAILAIRELVTLRSRYINANLYQSLSGPIYLTNYNCSGTTTGRRSSRKHAFGYGNNAQNFPKHGVLARIYRRCLISRPGQIFLMVDQMQAEDWPVSALAQNTAALDELQTGVDRHKKLACAVFNLSPDHYSEQGWKDSMERYLGKKTRHANNYGMKGPTMSDSLAKEGISMTTAACQHILDVANAVDPSIQQVFHKYVERELYDKRMLKTPWGRERQFFGLRGGDSSGNQKIFREAYSYIPQSTVGDNTGLAVYYLATKAHDRFPENILQEGHDSIVQEIPCDLDTIWIHLQRTIDSFRRTVKIGSIEFEIPVEGEIAFDFYSTVTLKNAETGSKKLVDIRYQDLKTALDKLQEKQEKELEIDLNAEKAQEQLDTVLQ